MFQFMTFHTKLQRVQKHCVIGSIKYMEIVCGGEFRYLLLFDNALCEEICDTIKYLISDKSGITDSINHNF